MFMKMRPVIAACLLALAALAAAAFGLTSPPQAEQQDVQRAVPRSEAAIRQSFSPVVKRVAPSVVNVYVRRRVAQQLSPFFQDPFFRRFFGEGAGIPRERMEQSLGSGVIVSADGVVVTNNHVIQGGKNAEITIAFADGREFPAKIVLADEKTDLAVLRIDAKTANFPHIEFVDSDALEVGDLVLAIGNPFGVGQTVTSGIVSALARTQIGIADYQFFVQTDAAINPGNSGGALVDVDGKLVGINTAIFSRTGASNGIGFAIPSNMVRVVVDSALKGGKVQRPWLGAQLQPLTAEIASSLGLDRPSGALVQTIAEKGPAAKAGLKVGDVIVGVDGKQIRDPRAFDYRFVTRGVGGAAEVAIMREGVEKSLKVTLETPPEMPPREQRDLKGNHPLAGARIVNLSPAVAEEFGLDFNARGVVIIDVEADSAAQSVGFRRGDILIGLNGAQFGSTSDVAEAVVRPADAWRLSLQREGRTMNLVLGG